MEQHHCSGGDDTRRALDRWVAAYQAQEAATSRTRQSWLRHQAAEETTWPELLLSWARRGTPVALRTSAARVLEGCLAGVGGDFVVVVPDARPGRLPGTGTAAGAHPRSHGIGPMSGPAGSQAPVPVATFVALGAIVSVRRLPSPEDPRLAGIRLHQEDLAPPSHPAPQPGVSSRSGRPGLSLAGALAEVADLGGWVEVTTGAGSPLTGRIRWVGVDVLCIRSDRLGLVYVPVASVIQVTVSGEPPRERPGDDAGYADPLDDSDFGSG